MRKNIKKKLLKGILNALLVILFLPPALTFLFHEPFIQTLTGRLATHILSDYTGYSTSIDALQIGLRRGIRLQGVNVKDHRDSTLLLIDHLAAKPMYAGLGLLSITFSKIEMDGVEFRLAQYAGDEDLNLLMLINKFADTSSVDRQPASFKLKTKKLFLRDALFQYYNEEMEVDADVKMDYSNIVFDSIYLAATGFEIIDDSLNFKIDSLFVNEKSGIKIDRLQTDFIISRSGLHARKLTVKMNQSSLDLDFGFEYPSYRTYRYFIDSVNIYADVRPSMVMMSDIGFFSTNMEKMPVKVGVTGLVNGTVANLSGKNIRLHYNDHTRVAFDGQITGLPDIYTSYIVADISELQTNACELKQMKLPLDDISLDFTDYFSCRSDITASGDFKGYYNDFKARFDVKSREGRVGGTLVFNDKPKDTMYFDLIAKGDSVRIGKLLNQRDLLGNVNFDINLKGGGKNSSALKLKAGGTLRAFDFMGYRYSRMRFSGRYQNDLAEGNLVFGDPNLMMSADVVAHTSGVPEFNIVADIRMANLEKLKLWTGYDFAISTQAVVNFKGLEVNDMTGSIVLDSSQLAFGDNIYELNSAVISKTINGDSLDEIDITSDFADLNLSGKYELTNLPDQFFALVNHYLDAMPDADSVDYEPGEYANLTLTLHNDDLITNHFVPGMEISPETSLNASIDFVNNKLNASSSFDRLLLAGVEMRGNMLGINSKNNKLNLVYTNKNTVFRDSTATSKTVFGIDNFMVKANALRDSLTFEVKWDNADSMLLNQGDIGGYYAIKPQGDYFRISRSDVYINDTLWTIDPRNMVVMDTSGTYIRDMNIFGGDSKMNLAGKWPQKNLDSLMVTFDQWNLSNFDMLTRLWKFELDGIVNGQMQYELVNNYPVVVSDLTIDSLLLNKVYLGKASFFNTWNNQDNSISIQSNVVRTGNSGSGEVIAVNGIYYPLREENAIDLNLAFNRIKIKALEPFFMEFISQLEGFADGELKLSGSFNKPVLTGIVDMHRTQLLVNYLNTKYSFSNVIHFEEDRINFGDLVIYDTLGNFATVEGSLMHRYFQNTAFNVKISTDKLLAFNTTHKMNDLYYGTGQIAGNLDIRGTAKSIKLYIDVSTMEGTDVKLPLDYSVEISDKDYIIFVDHTDTLTGSNKLMNEREKVEREDRLEYEIYMSLSINPQARVTIFLPSDMGRIESEGRGMLKMQTNTTGDFTLVGDYIVERGFFHFSLANLVSKRFGLVEGGRISWTGNPYEANLSIKGLYRLKTSLSSLGLVMDSTSAFRNKVTVDSYVILKNQLLNPDIRFEILFPDLNPDLQRMVYAELDTTNQAMMNEQMISLLVLGTFSYSNASNVSLSSTYYNVIANQLSNMLSKISDDFDVGLNYRPGDNVSQEEFEVALSTQLFDDRLMIDGRFGVTNDRSGQQASNIVGDVDLGYKITEDGQWIIKAFNHSNVNSWYNYSNYDKVAPYTQGVGIAFRREFTHISELFKRNKPRKGEMKEEENETEQ